MVVLYWGFPGANYVALAIFIIASFTDMLDGKIARKYHLVTDFGKFADPLADKMLTTAAMLWFVENGQMAAWALLIVVCREFAVSGLRMLAADKGKVIAAGWSGKVKTASTMVCLVLMFGVTAGIEKVSKVLMPLFYVLFLGLAIWVGTQPGAGEGYRFLFVPDWSKLLEVDTWVLAMGQAFFTLSITGSGMIVYGAYLDKKEDIPKASIRTAVFDTMAALLAGLAIMPAVFAYGLDAARGPSLMFITLPTVFQQMPMGRLFSVFFFVSVLFAGITSLINMFEAVIESWQSHFKLGRRTSVLICSALTLGVGIFMEGEAQVGPWMDFITIVVVPIGAVLGAVAAYYVLGWPKLRAELQTGREKPMSALFGAVGRYLYVPLTILVVVLGFVYKGIG